jgi:hypothetical protein
MPKPWKEVAASPEYQALAPDQQNAAREQYFSQVVAPQISDPSQVQAAKAQFDAQTAPSMPTMTVTGAPEEKPNGLGSDWQNYAAAMGKSVVDNGRGLYQAGLALAKNALSGEGAINRVLGREDVLGNKVQTAYDASKQAEAEARLRDEPLMSTKAGLAGNITGYGLQMALPIAATRGTPLAGIAAPTSARGMALQGGLMGAIKPLANDEGEGSRLNNALVGTGAGLAGSLVPRLIGATYRGITSLAQPFFKGGQETIAAGAIRDLAQNPAAIARVAPSAVPGVQRTLAEETLDPGIAQLQRQYAVQLADQQAQSNAARVAAIRSNFNGADAAGEQAAKDAADRAAIPLLRQAQRSGAQVNTDPVIAATDKLMAQSKGNPAAVDTIQRVKDELLPDGMPERGVAALYNTRKFIDDLLAGRAGGDTNAAKSATVQLQLIKKLLDRQIKQAAPEFGQYLNAYRQGMKPANQAAVGAELLSKGGAVPDAITGERTLTPAAFSRATNDLDQLASQATGFAKARAATTLTPQQQSVIQSVRDDLSRLNYANTAGRGVGSPTANNLATQNVLSNFTRGLGAGKSIIALEPVKRISSVMEKTYGLFGVPQRLHDIISTALADPAYARQIIAKLPNNDRSTVEAMVSRLTGPGAVVLSETQK